MNVQTKKTKRLKTTSQWRQTTTKEDLPIETDKRQPPNGDIPRIYLSDEAGLAIDLPRSSRLVLV